MKKMALMVLVIVVFLAPSAFAQFRIDLGLDIPVRMGVQSSDLTTSSDSTIDVLDDYTFLLPEATGSYQMSFGPLKVGAGIQLYSFILESIAWPVIYGEIDFSRFVLTAKGGGLGFLVFGLYTNGTTSNVIIPDINLSYRLGKSFRLGIGVTGFTGSDLNTSGIPYMIYLSGKTSILF